MAKNKSSKSFLSDPKAILIIILFVAAGAYFVGANKGSLNLYNSNTSNGVADEAGKSISDIPSGGIDGADIANIKYTLPQGWTAKLNADNLFIAPANGGYLSIKVYSYPGTTGRREYYCQVKKVCIEGTSYFDAVKIGNIDGYKANAIDNSGGGVEYFGAKGNKFYIISSYNPPSPNEFENNREVVLNSLVF